MQRRKKNPHFPGRIAKPRMQYFWYQAVCPQDHENFALEDVRFQGKRDAGKAGLS